MQQLKYLFIVPLLMGMCGCSPMQHQFDCGSDVGLKCKSLGEVDEMIGEGGFHLNTSRHFDLPHLEKDVVEGIETSHPLPTPEMKRIPEEVATIWFAAHETAAGDYEGETVRKVVITPARWDVTHKSGAALVHKGIEPKSRVIRTHKGVTSRDVDSKGSSRESASAKEATSK